jgi:hypothetical protein
LPFDDSVVGLRVNPSTDITNIMMGAFANMPRDWWAASTNHNASGKGYMEKTDQFERYYLFNWSKVNQDVYYMSRFWMSVFRGKNSGDAENLYRSADDPDLWKERLDGYTKGLYNKDMGYFGGLQNVIDWFTGEVKPDYTLPENHGEDVQGILQEDLTLADRKFLYGYLKGCFANTHQLFLVFVRAESAAGGGGAGSGARAVALVWRDPRASGNASSRGEDNAKLYMKVQDEGEDVNSWRLDERKYPPHRCQVLFYHQLD